MITELQLRNCESYLKELRAPPLLTIESLCEEETSERNDIRNMERRGLQSIVHFRSVAMSEMLQRSSKCSRISYTHMQVPMPHGVRDADTQDQKCENERYLFPSMRSWKESGSRTKLQRNSFFLLVSELLQRESMGREYLFVVEKKLRGEIVKRLEKSMLFFRDMGSIKKIEEQSREERLKEEESAWCRILKKFRKESRVSSNLSPSKGKAVSKCNSQSDTRNRKSKKTNKASPSLHKTDSDQAKLDGMRDSFSKNDEEELMKLPPVSLSAPESAADLGRLKMHSFPLKIVLDSVSISPAAHRSSRSAPSATFLPSIKEMGRSVYSDVFRNSSVATNWWLGSMGEVRSYSA